MNTKELVSQLLTHKSVTPSQYRVTVVAAEIADDGKDITASAIRQKISLSNSYAHKLLVDLAELNILAKTPKRRGCYHFNPQRLWFSKKIEPQPEKKSLDTAANNELLSEVKALQELTKDLISKLNH